MSSTKSKEAAIETRDARDLGSFITSYFDDYGLDPIEFRIYARLCRRANAGKSNAFESVPNMSKSLAISERRIRYALRLFERANLVTAIERPGKTTQYILTAESEWAAKSDLDRIRENIRPKHKQTDTPAPGAAPMFPLPPAPSAGDPCTTCSPTPAPGAAKGTSIEGTSFKKPIGNRLDDLFPELIVPDSVSSQIKPDRAVRIFMQAKASHDQVQKALYELAGQIERCSAKNNPLRDPHGFLVNALSYTTWSPQAESIRERYHRH